MKMGFNEIGFVVFIVGAFISLGGLVIMLTGNLIDEL